MSLTREEADAVEAWLKAGNRPERVRSWQPGDPLPDPEDEPQTRRWRPRLTAEQRREKAATVTHAWLEERRLREGG
jgi:hypothetical protein